MATFTTNKRYITQAVGENAGTWGTELNDKMITYLDTNLGGVLTYAVTAGGSLYLTESESRNANLVLTGSPAVTTTVYTYPLAGPVIYGFLFIENRCSTSSEVRIANVAVPGTYAVIPQNVKALVFSDATYGVRIISQTYTNLVTTFSAGTTGLTPNTATSGAVTLSGTLGVENGGTGLATLTANNVILGNGTSAPTFVAPSTSGNFLTSNGTTWISQSYDPLNYGTAQTPAVNTTNFITFANAFPDANAVKRITIILSSISSTGGGQLYIQLGSGSTTWADTGYIFGGNQSSPAAGFTWFTLTSGSGSADLWTGTCVLNRLSPSSDTWFINSNISIEAGGSRIITGYKAMPATLTGVRLGVTAGSFDNGTMNIMWET